MGKRITLLCPAAYDRRSDVIEPRTPVYRRTRDIEAIAEDYRIEREDLRGWGEYTHLLQVDTYGLEGFYLARIEGEGAGDGH